MKKNVYLIGFMGSGKTTVGMLLAGRLGLPFVDTDSVIEKEEGMPIPEIFRERGEPYFRAVENQKLRRLTKKHGSSGFVMSTGGGMPCSPTNIRYMKEHGTVIYLKTGVDDILSRVKEPIGRPVFSRLRQGNNQKEAVQALLETREIYYSKADITVSNTKDMTTRLVVEKIMTSIEG
jgi:shikimate kinase